ncbi:hypothetical protein [Phenylobacterium sp.]|uniref:hypothetical protein n=1 Tax=Phenylobacterium sp. TaxID=1871053 RepID=UPI003567BEB5
MSPASDATSDPLAPDAAPPAALAKTRPFYWSVRRELWENRSVYLAPLTVAGLGLLGFLFSLHGLPHAVRAAKVAAAASAALPADAALAKVAARAAGSLAIPYDFVTGVIFLAALAVAIFYSLAALHGERRDRSILFWKSLPVSDLTTVLSKVAVPLVVQPLVVFVVVIPVHLVMLAMGTAVLSLNGLDPSVLWTHAHLLKIWLTLPYGLVVLSLWYAPICGWLMLVSAWAKRTPILWGLGAPLGLCLFEYLAFRTQYLWQLLLYRLRGGFAEAFTVGGEGRVPINGPEQIDLTRFLSLPGLWAGLVFFVACIAACVWLRRRREPI